MQEKLEKSISSPEKNYLSLFAIRYPVISGSTRFFSIILLNSRLSPTTLFFAVARPVQISFYAVCRLESVQDLNFRLGIKTKVQL